MRTLQDMINEAADEIVEASWELDTIDERVEAFMILVDIIDPDLDHEVREDIKKQMLESEKKRLN